MGAPILFRTCLAKMASSRTVFAQPVQVCRGCGKSEAAAGLNFGAGRVEEGFRWAQVRSVVSYGSRVFQKQGGNSAAARKEVHISPETDKTQLRSKSVKVSRSLVTEAGAEDGLQDDSPESDDQYQNGGIVDEAESADEELEEVLAAMSSPINLTGNLATASSSVCVGIDPDLSGAIAVLTSRDESTVAEVIDVPCVTVTINKKMRRRHDYESIAAIVRQLRAPQGSIAFVEQARPFPKDGKQGWYITGYGYGVWLGILAAAGFTVVPVRAQAWKTAMGICGKEFTKDDSRALASSLFPVLSSQLRRKKDHGRADALLIAAFGKGMTVTGVTSLDEPNSSSRKETPDQPAASLPVMVSLQEPPF